MKFLAIFLLLGFFSAALAAPPVLDLDGLPEPDFDPSAYTHTDPDFVVYNLESTFRMKYDRTKVHAYLWAGDSIFDLPRTLGMLTQFHYGDPCDLSHAVKRVPVYLLGEKGILVMGIPLEMIKGFDNNQDNNRFEAAAKEILAFPTHLHASVPLQAKATSDNKDQGNLATGRAQSTFDHLNVEQIFDKALESIGTILDSGALGLRFRKYVKAGVAFRAIGEEILQKHLKLDPVITTPSTKSIEVKRAKLFLAQNLPQESPPKIAISQGTFEIVKVVLDSDGKPSVKHNNLKSLQSEHGWNVPYAKEPSAASEQRKQNAAGEECPDDDRDSTAEDADE